jgi:hypothetical protein
VQILEVIKYFLISWGYLRGLVSDYDYVQQLDFLAWWYEVYKKSTRLMQKSNMSNKIGLLMSFDILYYNLLRVSCWGFWDSFPPTLMFLLVGFKHKLDASTLIVVKWCFKYNDRDFGIMRCASRTSKSIRCSWSSNRT